MADDVLRQGIQGISELITVPGLINLDFADVRAIMSEGGAALMAVGHAAGEDRARIAAELAISSQLLDITIDGARGILFNVTGGPNLTLFEVNQAAAIIKETAHPDVNLIFGAVIDPNMGDEMRITVIATGFDRTASIERPAVPLSEKRSTRVEDTPSIQRQRPTEQRYEQQPPVRQPVQSSANDEFQRVVINTEDLDVPAFLRNRRTKANSEEPSERNR